MGDRANVAIVQHGYADRPADTEPPAIWVYLHWGGSTLPVVLQAALLKARSRWDDEPYGTHILIDQLTKECRDNEAGCGISLGIGDNEYDVLVVDLTAQRVRLVPEGLAKVGILLYGNATASFTFAEYLALPMTGERRDAGWNALKSAAHT